MISALVVTVLLSQSISTAEKEFEDGRYQACVSTLDAFERSEGKSPRTQSLRVHALAAMGRTREALLAGRIYQRLTEGLPLSSNPGHRELLALIEQLKSTVRAELEREAEAMRQKADAEERAIDEREEQRLKAEAERRTRAFEARTRAVQDEKILEDIAATRAEQQGKSR